MMIANLVSCWLDSTFRTDCMKLHEATILPFTKSLKFYVSHPCSAAIFRTEKDNTKKLYQHMPQNLYLAICFFGIPRDMVKDVFTCYQSKEEFKLKQND